MTGVQTCALPIWYNDKIVIATVPDENLTYFCMSFTWEEDEQNTVREWEQLLSFYE